MYIVPTIIIAPTGMNMKIRICIQAPILTHMSIYSANFIPGKRYHYATLSIQEGADINVMYNGCSPDHRCAHRYS